jgi:membrane-associated phospholipid phosphatase
MGDNFDQTQEKHFYLFDWICLGYLFLIGVSLLFFHRNVSDWLRYVTLHAAGIVMIGLLIQIHRSFPQNRILRIARYFYPIALMPLLWEELEPLVPMFFGVRWATDVIARLDVLLFGIHPTVWVQQLYRPWLNELMGFFYVAYYALFLIIPISLFVKKKRKALLAVLSVIMLTYLSNFFLFFVFPAAAPHHIPEINALHTQELIGPFFSRFNREVQSSRGIVGAAFPSSHVAGTLVWVLLALRYHRRLGIFLIPIAIGMPLASVYLRLHHALDPIVGLIWGLLCFAAALKLIQKRGEDPL